MPQREAPVLYPELPGEFAEHMAAIAREQKPWPVADGDRHHFVPEFVLRRFVGRTDRGRKLFVLNKQTGEVSSSTPKEAGWEHRLYAVESLDGRHDGVIEGIFGLAESYAATSLDRLTSVAGPTSFSDSDRGNVAYLVAAQEQRVPGALEELRLNLVIAGSTHAAVELANQTGAARKRRLGKEAYKSMIAGELNLAPSNETVLEFVLLGMAHMATVIYGHPWTLLRARPGAGAFVTSDRPLTMYDPTPPHKFSAPAWMSSPNVAATLPLSRSTCLRISPRDRAHLLVRETTKQVERVNQFTYGFADKYVYGPSEKQLVALHEWATTKPDEVPKPIPKRMVLLEDLDTADPSVAEANVQRGWDKYLVLNEDDGTQRLMSYEVIDTLDDAMRAIAPREGPSSAAHGSPVEMRRPAHPPQVFRAD